MAKQYSSSPAMQIDPNKSYTATFDTENGGFVVDLFAKQAPIPADADPTWHALDARVGRESSSVALGMPRSVGEPAL